jgi:hypothetical protein
MKPCLIAFTVIFGFVALVAAAPSSQPVLLGDEFVSDTSGIALRPPVNCDQEVTNVPDQIVEFDDANLLWTLKVTRRSLESPVPLTDVTDADGNKQQGLLELSVKQLKDQPVSQVVSQHIMQIGPDSQTFVGVLTMRYDHNLKRRLRQEAIVAATDRLYYFIDLESPARQSADDTAEDLGERQAMDAFSAVVNSVRLLNAANIYNDQADRLLRTRNLIFNWKPAYLKAHVIPQQYFLVVRDGKNFGYSFETEEFDDKAGAIAKIPIVRVSMRSETFPRPDTDVQLQSRLTSTTNLGHEDWENLATTITSPTPEKKLGTHSLFSEIGTSLKTTKIRPVIHPADRGAPIPPGQQGKNTEPDWVTRESWTLTVIRRGVDLDNPDIKQDLPQYKTDLPAFYVPQALSHMIPHLLPFRQARTYLFATYVPNGDNGSPAVMLRYMDVLPPAEVTFNGKSIVAVPVHDRLGVDGPVQTHYLDSDDGSYLGTLTTIKTKDGQSTEIVVPTDAATLRKIWPLCNLTPPDRIVETDTPVKGK